MFYRFFYLVKLFAQITAAIVVVLAMLVASFYIGYILLVLTVFLIVGYLAYLFCKESPPKEGDWSDDL